MSEIVDIEQSLSQALDLSESGRLDEAEQLLRPILQQQHNHQDALTLLGMIAVKKGDPRAGELLDRAAAAYRQLIADLPQAKWYYNLAMVLRYRGLKEQALEAVRQAIALKPEYFEAWNNLGNLLEEAGQLDEALAAYRKAVELFPKFADAYYNLGNLYNRRGEIHLAIGAYQRAVMAKPAFPLTLNNLGNLLRLLGQTDAAIQIFQHCLSFAPKFPEAWNNLGMTHRDAGQLDEALDCMDWAMKINPAFHEAHSNRIYLQQFHPKYAPAALAAELKNWEALHAAPLKKYIRTFDNDRTPERKLRIGYVSPDFYRQSKAHFIVPLLQGHDHAAFDIYCYSGVLHPDDVTHRLHGYADGWCNTVGMDDASLANQIRNDRIDILVDLTMHMPNNRLLTFARKPAPVQATWLAYPGSTGLGTMDYRITDARLNPLDANESFDTEQAIRLPDCWLCYDPLIDNVPACAARPPGAITFGCLNAPWKINDTCLKTWAQVLKAIPGSQLKLQLVAKSQCEQVHRLMFALGILAGRIEFLHRCPREQYLRLYDQIDIALDPLPCNGIATTCEALWMGVPALTQTSGTTAGRAGTSILNTVGLADWVAGDAGQLVQLAVRHTSDWPRLQALRQNLRAQVQASPLMDRRKFTANMEAAYRQMWRAWVKRK